VQRFGGLTQAGLPLPFGRAINFQICTNFRASHCPACAKPPVPVAQLACKGKKIIDSKYCFEIGVSKK
jgi:hypothetical protein